MYYACPKCKGTDLRVEVTAVAVVLQDKDGNLQTDIDSDHDWDDKSLMLCNSCEHSAPSTDFRLRDKYEPYLRPASSFSLPKDITWEYVEAPWEGVNRPDLPRSLNRYGVISVDRRLTIEECEHFGLRVA